MHRLFPITPPRPAPSGAVSRAPGRWPCGRRVARRSVGAACLALTGLALLEPLTGTILARFVLGERLSAAGITGAVLLAVAVLLTMRARTESGPSLSVKDCHGSESQEYLRSPSAGMQPKSLCFNLDCPDGASGQGELRRSEKG